MGWMVCSATAILSQTEEGSARFAFKRSWASSSPPQLSASMPTSAATAIFPRNPLPPSSTILLPRLLASPSKPERHRRWSPRICHRYHASLASSNSRPPPPLPPPLLFTVRSCPPLSLLIQAITIFIARTPPSPPRWRRRWEAPLLLPPLRPLHLPLVPQPVPS